MTGILIADDERMIRFLVRGLIEGLRLPVTVVGEASNGEECFELFQKHKPSIVITDIVMPRSDGLDLLAKIKSIAPDTLIILLSAYQNFEYAQQAVRGSAFDYLLKPVQEEEIRRVLEKALKQLDEMKRRSTRLSEMKEKLTKFQSCLTGGSEPEETRFLDPVDKAIHYVDQNYFDEISLKGISAKFFFSPAYFSDLLKKKTGKSFNDYLNDLRINKAKELLQTPELKVTEVSELVGYHNCSYFIRIFREKTGQTPNDFRRAQQGYLHEKHIP